MQRHPNVGFELMISLGTLASMPMGGGLLSNKLHVQLDAPIPTEDNDEAPTLIAGLVRKYSHVIPYNNNAGGESQAEVVGDWMRRVADALERSLLELNGFAASNLQINDADNQSVTAVIQIRPIFQFPTFGNVPEL